MERKGPAFARRDSSELRPGKREGRKEILSYFASFATSAFNRDVLKRLMARKLKSDRLLFLTTILLVGLSIVMVYSASAVVTLERYGKPSMFLIKQGMWAVLGVAMLAVVMRIDYRTYRQPVFIWTALGVVGAALVAVLFMVPVNNARRWFGIGSIGVQPSELAKLSTIFFIAALLERRMHRIDELTYSLLPIGIRSSD
ncbi:MAG: hypothetical protein DMF97_15780 [Acidobacteria bacterium]|nr:MAG: hypothetical protein DMF97_15780 [Acidobacteriota bacterium]